MLKRFSIDTIYLDIDGVLNRFQLEALQEVGCQITDESEYPVECQWDIVGAAQRLGVDVTEQEFWDAIPRCLWETSEKTSWAGMLIGRCRRVVGHRNMYLLTSPTLDPECAAGKLKWIQTFLPNWLHRQFLMGPVKHCCARPGALLIDDSDKNVNAFRSAGGEAFLFPRPWNSAHEQANCAVSKTIEFLDELP